jgi:hypothetical protein
MNAMKDEELKAIEVRVEAATPGPWTLLEVHGGDVDPWCVEIGQTGRAFVETVEDGKFIVHARADVPFLIATLRGLYAQLDELVAAHELICAIGDKSSGSDAFTAAAMEYVSRKALHTDEPYREPARSGYEDYIAGIKAKQVTP